MEIHITILGETPMRNRTTGRNDAALEAPRRPRQTCDDCWLLPPYPI